MRQEYQSATNLAEDPWERSLSSECSNSKSTMDGGEAFRFIEDEGAWRCKCGKSLFVWLLWFCCKLWIVACDGVPALTIALAWTSTRDGVALFDEEDPWDSSGRSKLPEGFVLLLPKSCESAGSILERDCSDMSLSIRSDTRRMEQCLQKCSKLNANTLWYWSILASGYSIQSYMNPATK